MQSLNYKDSIPHPALRAFNDEKYYPDFIVNSLDDTWEIFELKLPYEKLLKDRDRRNTFYAKVYSYLEQCVEYSDFFADNTNRLNFENDYRFSIPTPPNGNLIIGRDADLDRYELLKILNRHSRKIRILTYDDIIRHIEFDKAKVLGRYEKVDGLTIHFVITIRETDYPNQILFLGNKTESNAISLLINLEGSLVIRLKDKKGNLHETSISSDKSKFEFDKPMYFLIELGLTTEYTVYSVDVNGHYGSVGRIEKIDFDTTELISNMVIGSDCQGNNNSEFDLYEFIVWPHTFDLESRNKLRYDVLMNFIYDNSNISSFIRFSGNTYLYKNSHINFKKDGSLKSSDLAQTQKKKQPFIFVDGKNQGFVSAFYDQSK